MRRSIDPHPEPCPVALGLDVGGSKIAAGLVRPDGRVLERRQIPTRPERGGAAVLEDTLALATELATQAPGSGLTLSAVGVGLCELVDLQGRVVSGQTIDWRDLPVKARLDPLAPAWIDADSRAAGYAEARFGTGRPFRSFLYLTVGTGIGSSLLLEGQPYRGARGSTGTLASAPLTVFDPATGRAVRTVLEEFAAGPALVRRYRQSGSRSVQSAEQVLAAAAQDDSSARDVVSTAAEALAAILALLVNVLDPQAVVVGGGLGMAPGLYWETLVASTRQHIWSDTHRDLPILQAALGADAGIVGAAALALERVGGR